MRTLTGFPCTVVSVTDSGEAPAASTAFRRTSARFLLSSEDVMDRINDVFKDTPAGLIANTSDKDAKPCEVFAEE